jgi:membrane protein YqaA with SNARE-associated domain
MKQIVSSLQSFAMAIGGPGLFVIALLDSSFLSFPEINDILIVYMVTQHPHRLIYYASMSTLGSIAGCGMLYYVARRGGREFMLKRFSAQRLERGLEIFRRYGLMAVFIPSLLPPPAPFKIFVLLAGLAAVKPRSFIAAIAIGRGLRYFGEGLLAVYYGEAAMAYVRENSVTVSLWAAGIVTVLAVGYVLWNRRGKSAAESP